MCIITKLSLNIAIINCDDEKIIRIILMNKVIYLGDKLFFGELIFMRDNNIENTILQIILFNSNFKVLLCNIFITREQIEKMKKNDVK